jgi:hypothetical protein
MPWSFVTPMLCSGLPIHDDGTPVNASVSCISNQIFVCTYALWILLSFLILYTWKALRDRKCEVSREDHSEQSI